MNYKIIFTFLFSFTVTASPVDFFLERVPNWRELSKQGFLGAVVEVTLGDYLESIKNDECAKSFVRDLALAPVIAWNIIDEERVAGLNYTYDQSHTWAHSSKLILKIGGGQLLVTLAGLDPEQAFRLASILGDSSGRLFINWGRFHQDSQDENASYDWSQGIGHALMQAGTNSLVMFQVNDLVNKKWGLVKHVGQGTMFLLNQLPFRQVHPTVLKLIIATAVAKMANTALLSPIGNTIMDLIKFIS